MIAYGNGRFFVLYALLCVGGTAGLSSAQTEVANNRLIEGYYTQEGQSLSRGQLEKFLLNQQNESAQLADKSKAYRFSAFAIGAPMWLATTGVTVWQIMEFVDAVKKNAMYSTNIMKTTVPLVIGVEITSFIQTRLRNRSNYLLHKAVKIYDSMLCAQHTVEVILDHQIKEVRPGWFLQDRILMPTPVLYPVLKEKSVSYASASWSIFCREFSFDVGLVGGILISNAIAGFVDGLNEKNTNKVNTSLRNRQAGIGFGLELLAAISSIISAGIRDKAIQQYNESLPKPPKPLQLYDQIPSGPYDYPPR
jgi:hypothetical protein